MIALVLFCCVLIVYACFVTAAGQRWKTIAKDGLEMTKRHEREHLVEIGRRLQREDKLIFEVHDIKKELLDASQRFAKTQAILEGEIADLFNERATDATELEETQATNVLLNQALDALKVDWLNLCREVEVSNAELDRAQEQVESLTLENYGLKEDLEALRAPVVKSTRKRKQK